MKDHDLRKALRRLPALAREWLFDGGCAVCGQALLEAADAWYGLCPQCRQLFSEPEGERRCRSCGKPLISERERCMACRTEGERAFDGGLLLYPYTADFRTALTAYKFRSARSLARFFAGKVEAALDLLRATHGLRSPALVPVPPRPGKVRRTGWDQVECLTRAFEREQRFTPPAQRTPVLRCLKRLPSAAQKTLAARERKGNLQGRIRCAGKAPQEAVLLDDVFTTGATLDACARALKEGGAATVLGLCLFYD